MKTSIKKIAGHITQIEFWVVAGFVLISMVSTRWIYLAVGVALVFWLLRKTATGRFSLRTAIDIPTAVLLLFALISMNLTLVPEKTYLQSARLFSGMGLYYALVNWTNTRKRLDWMVFGVTLATLLLALGAPISVEWTQSKLPFIPASLYERFQTRFQDTINPNVLAGTLVYFLPLPAAMLLFNWRETTRKQRLFISLTVIIAAGMLLLTKARGAWLTAGIVGLMLIIWRWRWGWITLPLSVSAAALVAWKIGLPEVLSLATSSGSIKGIPERLQIWERALAMMRDFPLTGIGMGTFPEITEWLYPFLGTEPEAYNHAHNLFLQIGVDLGVIGLLAWLIIVGVIIRSSLKIYQWSVKSDAPYWKALGVGLFCSQMALLLHGIWDAVTWGMVRSAPFVWVIWGICIAAEALIQHEAEKAA